MASVLSVTTTSMNSFLGSETRVPVLLGKSYTVKLARDLHPGDILVGRDEFIDKTLEDVEPILDQDQRYHRARLSVHEVNRNGDSIPRLRTLLLRGLVNHDATLESTILKEEGDDFGLDQYHSFAEQVHSAVQGVQEEAVLDWLRGETLAPRDWANLDRLRAINPEFATLYASAGQPGGFQEAYELYTGVRRTVMSHLAQRRGDGSGNGSENGTGNGSGRSSAPRGRYADQIELVVSRLMPEVDERHSGARVISVTHVKQSKANGSSSGRIPNPHLEREIVTGELPDCLAAYTPLSIADIIEQDHVLSIALSDVVFRYIRETMKVDLEGVFPSSYITLRHGRKGHVAMLVPSQAMYTLIRQFNEPDREVHRGQLQTIGLSIATGGFPPDYATVGEDANQVATQLVDAVWQGRIDALFRVPPNTVSRMVGMIEQLRGALPKKYYEVIVLTCQYRNTDIQVGNGTLQRTSVARMQEEREHQLSELKESLRRNYGWDGKGRGEFFLATLTLYDREIFMMNPPVYEMRFPEIRRHIEKVHPTPLYTRDQALDVVTKAGIPEAMAFFDSRHFMRGVS